MWNELPRHGSTQDESPAHAAGVTAPGGHPAHVAASSRRRWLAEAGCGFGGLALASLFAADARPAAAAVNPLAPRSPHHPARAKSVIFLFMDGGPSHIDTFDPKPAVNEYAGKPLPPSIKRAHTPMGVSENPLLASPRTWRQSRATAMAKGGGSGAEMLWHHWRNRRQYDPRPAGDSGK